MAKHCVEKLESEKPREREVLCRFVGRFVGRLGVFFLLGHGKRLSPYVLHVTCRLNNNNFVPVWGRLERQSLESLKCDVDLLKTTGIIDWRPNHYGTY